MSRDQAGAPPWPHGGLHHVQCGGLPLLRFAGLAALPGLSHGVTTRAGGVSVPPFDGLNLAYGDDDPAAVEQNLSQVQEALGLKRLVYARQVHGVEIISTSGQGGPELGQADGLCTDRPGVGLLIKTADCQAVVLYDPVKKVLANLHAGWRGNVQNMAGRGVEFMAGRFGVEPGDVHAAISPSLGPCCAEFVNHTQELGEDFEPYQVSPNHFDLWAVTVDQLTSAGVKRENIEVAGICTKCDERFYSYRRQRRTGRFGTIVAMEAK